MIEPISGSAFKRISIMPQVHMNAQENGITLSYWPLAYFASSVALNKTLVLHSHSNFVLGQKRKHGGFAVKR